MSFSRSRIVTFVGELKRRRVIRVALAYAVGGWLIIQVAATVFPHLDLPPVLVRAIIVLVALGFPLAIILSWAFDITPDGVQRTPNRGAEIATDGERHAARAEGNRAPAPAAIAATVAPASHGGNVSGVDAKAAGRDSRTRLIALPFHLLRPDSETGFLAFSLPDAVTSSLSGVSSLIVRSQLAAQRYADARVDLEEIGARAQVDVVLTGTLLRIGEKLAVTAQLTDVRDGTLLWAEEVRIEMGDLFQLQEQLTTRIVSSLRLPLTDRDRRRLGHDVPASARAYEFFLRANDVAYHAAQWSTARDLYLESVREDPEFAPAWARLARCYRVLAKYGPDADGVAGGLQLAVDAFERALRLNPDLSLAHNLYAQLEADLGRAEEAMVRLLKRARDDSSDAQVHAGLVHACRYLGLLDASLAAHYAARRLDPEIPTSVSHTLLMLGEYERALEFTHGDIGYVAGVALAALGRNDEAISALRQNEAAISEPRVRAYLATLRTLLEGDRPGCLAALQQARRGQTDGEAAFYMARTLAQLGEHDQAIASLAEAADHGFVCAPAYERDPWLDPLRGNAGFIAIVQRARAATQHAETVFTQEGGRDLLSGPPRVATLAPHPTR